jgi:hypothetical protein
VESPWNVSEFSVSVIPCVGEASNNPTIPTLNILQYVKSIKTALLVTTTDELIKIRDRYSKKVPKA